MTTLEDKYEALSALLKLSSPLDLGDKERDAEKAKIGKFNGLEDVYDRAFILRRVQAAIDAPAEAPRILRSFAKDGLIRGPYPTSRQKQFMRVYHLIHENLIEEQVRIEPELDA